VLCDAENLVDGELLGFITIESLAHISLGHSGNFSESVLRKVVFLKQCSDILLEQFKIQF